VIDAHDPSPVYRDEQRTFLDSCRDLLAAENGWRVIRLKDGAIDWARLMTTPNLPAVLDGLRKAGLQPVGAGALQ
jgi:hypothetical protein